MFSKNGGGRVFTTNSALRMARAPSLGVDNKEIVVRLKQKLKMTSVAQFLDRWGYQKTDRVESPLDYTIRGGILDGEYISASNVKALAKLPSKEMLIGQFVGGLQSIISRFVMSLSAPTRGLVYTLEQIKNNKNN